MRGVKDEAVVLHRKSFATKQTSLRGAKRRGNLTISARSKSKKCRHKIKITPLEKVRMLILGKNQQNKLISLKLNINVGRFYE